VLSVLGQDIALRTRSRASDEDGDFALVEESSYDLADGFRLSLVPEYDEDTADLGVGLELRVEREGAARAHLRELARGAGFEPTMLIAPPEASLSVYIAPWGTPDGSGSLGPRVSHLS
jgi:hypothetical protein